MVFIVVEKKDKDLYVIYDKENGGVCCCSLYTIKQLTEMGHKVIGYSVVNGRRSITEHNLDGSISKRKAVETCCADTTKRSAVTIAGGLSAKKYPRIKQNRRGQFGTEKPGTVLRVILDDKTSILLLLLDAATGYTPDGKLLTLRDLNVADILAANKEETALMLRLYNKYKAVCNLEAERNKLNHQLKMANAALEAEKKQCAFEYQLLKVTGAECFDYSFARANDCGITNDFIMAVITKSERPITYTRGLSYRNPAIHNVSLTKQQALDIVKKDLMLTVEATADKIHLNTYSENDMW